MKFSKFLKNMNRGIALLLMVAIGFAGYVVYDYTAFAAESPEIEAFLKEYTLKTASMTLLPEAERHYQNVSESAVKRKIAENNQILNQYWTAVQTLTYYPGKRSVAQQFEEVIERTIEKDPERNGIILDADVAIDQVKNVKKTSPNTATADISFAINYRYQGNPALYVSGIMDANNEPISDSNVRRFKNEVSVTYGLLKTKSGWKISWEVGYSYGSYSVTIEGEDQNGSSSAD